MENLYHFINILKLQYYINNNFIKEYTYDHGNCIIILILMEIVINRYVYIVYHNENYIICIL